jgi:hypothetical protein
MPVARFACSRKKAPRGLPFGDMGSADETVDNAVELLRAHR